MKIKFIPSAAALLILPFSCAAAASGGNSTGQILKLGVGARNAALGDSGAADSGDSSAIFWNPAGLGFVKRCSVSTSYSSLFESVSHGAASAACPVNSLGAVAVGGQFLNYGKLDSRDNTGALDGEFTPSDKVFSASWGFGVGKIAAFGVTAKKLYVKIDEHASANAADIGLMLRFSAMTVGAALKNTRGKLKLGEVSENLPKTATIGAKADLDPITIMADMNSSKDGGWISSGVEYCFSPKSEGSPVTLRAGYSTRMKTKGNNLTFGAGIADKSWALDYALVPYGELGLTHHVSVAYLFGKTVRKTSVKIKDKSEPFQDRPGLPSDHVILIPTEMLPRNYKP
ncbi:MAG: hypothetical protein A2270_11470 [Elusimicrobia bacterium RIFOXYA12_FULL_51_18]|nr:MAG: hypothetical protein A2270_11470 [Elusimicrobia bacterium RIFOXYA12_FULL_51_18]OGS30363.1 MAG: hypothetical protein A2218_01745 [Elusimicrobia bacterium RIFOXYA2_FULL_53_38]